MQTAGLGRLLSSPGNIQLLVPSDRAFVDLLDEMALDWSCLCADLPRLRALLLGHVLIDDMPLATAGAGAMIRTANQGILHLHGAGRLQDGHGRQAQLLAQLPHTRCVTPAAYLIDRVIRPVERGLLELLSDCPDHSEFLAALRHTGVGSWLTGGGPFTVFAPDNAGWTAQLTHLQRDGWSTPSANPALTALVSSHLLAGRWLSDELPWGGALTSLSGEALRLSPLGLIGDGPCSQALLSGSDRLARNGVLHRLTWPLGARHGEPMAYERPAAPGRPCRGSHSPRHGH